MTPHDWGLDLLLLVTGMAVVLAGFAVAYFAPHWQRKLADAADADRKKKRVQPRTVPKESLPLTDQQPKPKRVNLTKDAAYHQTLTRRQQEIIDNPDGPHKFILTEEEGRRFTALHLPVNVNNWGPFPGWTDPTAWHF